MDRTFDAAFWTREHYFAIADWLSDSYMEARVKGAASGQIWGSEPSAAADRAHSIFSSRGVRTILDVGCGHGRDAAFFTAKGYRVTGIDRSPAACEVARNLAAGAARPTIIHADLRTFQGEPFDAVFANKLFHQFRHVPATATAGHPHLSVAAEVVDRLAQWVRPGGLLALATFSTDDPLYGRGRYIEENTFDTRGYRPCVFYSEERVRGLLSQHTLIHIEHLSFEEGQADYGGRRQKCMWFVVAVVNPQESSSRSPDDTAPAR